MILPSKHLKLSNSLLNVGAVLLNNLDEKNTVTMLWDKTRRFSEIRTFDKFTLGLDLLFVMNLVKFQDGLITRVAK